MTNHFRRILSASTILVGLAAAVASPRPYTHAAALVDDPLERGTFMLFKFGQQVGKELYEIRSDADGTTLTSDFEFTDRGTNVPLSTTFRLDGSRQPAHLVLSGRTARTSTIDLEVTIERITAVIREGTSTRSQPAPAGAFTLAGYAPLAVQAQLMAFWRSHGHPSAIPLLPRGTARVEARGRDTFQVGGRRVTLERFSVSGVIWGREALWCDEDGRLAAVVGVDAEFDHFEATRPDLVEAVPALIGRAASDGMAALAKFGGADAPAPSRVIVVSGGTVVKGTDEPPITNASVVIRNGVIEWIGSAADVRIPANATVIDASGKTVIPGLWDMHAHFEQVEWGPIYLASGVTTVRDVGNELEFISAVRDAVASGKGLGPRLLLAGIIDGDGPRALGVTRAATPDEGRAWVRRYHAARFDQIKVYSSMAEDVLRAVTAEAHSLGMTVTGHVPQGLDALQAIDDGLDQINHRQYVTPVMVRNAAGAIAAFQKHRTVIDPTLALYELLERPIDRPISDFEPGVLNIAPELAGPVNGMGLPPEQAEKAKKQLPDLRAMIGALHRAGVPIVAGTDQGVPGYSLHRELELYVDAGFTPLEALQAATIVPARAMKRDGDSGTIETGKRGDLVVLDANPLEDIHNSRRVHRVVTHGRVFDPAPLWRAVGFQP